MDPWTMFILMVLRQIADVCWKSEFDRLIEEQVNKLRVSFQIKLFQKFEFFICNQRLYFKSFICLFQHTLQICWVLREYSQKLWRSFNSLWLEILSFLEQHTKSFLSCCTFICVVHPLCCFPLINFFVFYKQGEVEMEAELA